MVSEPRPLLAQNIILVQYRAPKRADPDQSNALSLSRWVITSDYCLRLLEVCMRCAICKNVPFTPSV